MNDVASHVFIGMFTIYVIWITLLKVLLTRESSTECLSAVEAITMVMRVVLIEHIMLIKVLRVSLLETRVLIFIFTIEKPGLLG